jgi:FkbM family methyltransferase
MAVMLWSVGADTVQRLGRRLTTLPGLRRLSATRPVSRLGSIVLGARLVREPVRFAARELRGRGTGLYRLRSGGARVALRHGTIDRTTYDEVFHERLYAPPAPVREILASLDRPVVCDLGANVGMFGAWALTEISPAEIIAFEPDPANALVHEAVIAANDTGTRWRLERTAAGARDREASFEGGRFAESRLVSDVPGASVVRVRDVFPELQRADVLKIDVEGGEWELLGDPRLGQVPVRVIALEYHPHLCPEPDPEAAAWSALEEAGFAVAASDAWAGPEGHGMLWAWRSFGTLPRP